MEKERFNSLAKKLSITEDNLRALRDCSTIAAQLDDSAIAESKDRADQLEFLLVVVGEIMHNGHTIWSSSNLVLKYIEQKYWWKKNLGD